MASRRISAYKTERDRDTLLGLYDRVLAKWPLPFTELFLESRFGKTHVLACGSAEGPPVLLFHGTGNNSLMWRSNCEELGRRFRLYLVDTINDPGKSEPGAAFNAPEDYAAWTASVLDGLGLAKAHFIGHSKGGWLALNAAIAMPQRIGKLVLLAPAVGINEKLRIGFLLRSMRLGMNPTRENLRRYFAYMSPPGKAPNEAYLEYVSALIGGSVPDFRTRHRRFSDEELAAIPNPALMLFGEYETCNDFRAVIRRGRALIPGLECGILPGAGHGVQGDAPELVDRLIIDFLG